MSWYDTVFEVIDMRSFSNLWYWIALAVLWSSVSHWVLGVPFDMILRARRDKDDAGEAMADLQDLVRVNVNRILYIAEVSGVWLILFGSAVLTGLGVMAVLYDVEFAQATLFLALPMTILGLLSVWTSRKIRATAPAGRDLIRRLMTHRMMTQMLGVVSIFVTAMFGMYRNLHVVPFPN
ncbi:component of SufBCD complex [Alphaproteobacteria bacterium GH1-50]|uniref:Component of SufBCD complex n=1 Tax=Kangsaoukella pontilimi TaxID=2691042 RepID=A0A7C9MVZ5_9RHOB|nr:component of SufBCD complex [Kangsaoukella pontilimi]MXQ07234.1 component of SufBCD complex [Kangsaoukella pontilimi]